MSTRTQADLSLAILGELVGPVVDPEFKLRFLTDLSGTFFSMRRLDAEISEEYYQTQLSDFRRQMPAFRNWLEDLKKSPSHQETGVQIGLTSLIQGQRPAHRRAAPKGAAARIVNKLRVQGDAPKVLPRFAPNSNC
jgi:hypothetical protein